MLILNEQEDSSESHYNAQRLRSLVEKELALIIQLLENVFHEPMHAFESGYVDGLQGWHH